MNIASIVRKEREVIRTETMGDDEVILTELTIQGDLTINGGSNSIKLVDWTITGKVIMAKIGD